MSAAKTEKHSSLTGLHAAFADRLRRFFRSYRLNPADAEDLTQEVFVKLAGWGQSSALLKPEAVVFTLARNLLRDRARRLCTRATRHSVSIDEADLDGSAPSPDRLLESVQQLAEVDQALATLKPSSRHAFIQHRVHGESYSEIALQMNVSVSMVEKHIMAAINVLRLLDTATEDRPRAARDFGRLSASTPASARRRRGPQTSGSAPRRFA